MDYSFTRVSFSRDGARVPARLVRPRAAAGALPGVIVIHEVWGTDAHVRDVARRVAAAGYLALVPDLYARGGSRPPDLAADRVDALKRFAATLPPGGLGIAADRTAGFTRTPATERARLEATWAAVAAVLQDPDRSVADLRGAVAHLLDHPDCNGQIGAIGFGMGGGLCCRLACAEPGLRAAVAYDGASPPSEVVAGMACPLLGLYGGDDRSATGGIRELARAADAAGRRFEHHVYPGAPHAFFDDSRPTYRVAAARDAWARTLAFLSELLG